MLRIMSRRAIDDWIDKQPIGAEFTSLSILDGIWSNRYAPTRIQISSYLRWNEKVEKVGMNDSLILWRRVR